MGGPCKVKKYLSDPGLVSKRARPRHAGLSSAEKRLVSRQAGYNSTVEANRHVTRAFHRPGSQRKHK